jgi:hypothetical protein
MRACILTLALTVATLLQAGCAAGMRVGGENRGVGVGASVGPAPAPISYYSPDSSYVAPVPRPGDQ